MERLTGSIRQYAWGSTTGVPTILGTEPDGNPQAEYWLGAHPLAPSQLSSGEPLTQHLHVHPDELGSAGQRFEGRPIVQRHRQRGPAPMSAIPLFFVGATP